MKKPIQLVVLVTLLRTVAIASGDAVPNYAGSTNSFKIFFTYAREWEYASGARNDGPMLIITSTSQIGPSGHQGASFYYVGNLDVLKTYQSAIMAAQAQKKPISISYGNKWARYKNVLDDADYPINGAATGFKILGIEVGP